MIGTCVFKRARLVWPLTAQPSLTEALLGNTVFPPVYPADLLPDRDRRARDCPLADDGVRADTKAQQIGCTRQTGRLRRANDEGGRCAELPDQAESRRVLRDCGDAV